VTGGGIPVDRQQQLFMLAGLKGKKTPGEQAKFAWDTLSSQGHRVIKDGKLLETPEANLAHGSQACRQLRAGTTLFIGQRDGAKFK
jgi:hypothetical protein